MATNDSSDSDSDVDVCEAASKAALAKGISYCATPASRVNVLAPLLGFDADDIDPTAIIALDVDDESVDIRKRVLSRAEEIMDEGEEQPLDAINQAWSDVMVDDTELLGETPTDTAEDDEEAADETDATDEDEEAESEPPAPAEIDLDFDDDEDVEADPLDIEGRDEEPLDMDDVDADFEEDEAPEATAGE